MRDVTYQLVCMYNGSFNRKSMDSIMVPQQPVQHRSDDSPSANREHMIAFGEGNSDGLLAPATEIKPPELVKAGKANAARLVGVLRPPELPAKRSTPRIAVKAKGRIFFMEIADIIAVHAEGNYASLKCRSTPYFVRESLCSISVKLSPYGFIQIRRSVLVNISLVEEIQPLRTREYRLRVSGGAEYLVTRKYKDHLRCLAHLWFGSERLSSSGQEE